MPSDSYWALVIVHKRKDESYTIVPEGDVSFPPLKSNIDLRRNGQLVQVIDNCSSFCYRDTRYVHDKTYALS